MRSLQVNRREERVLVPLWAERGNTLHVILSEAKSLLLVTATSLGTKIRS